MMYRNVFIGLLFLCSVSFGIAADDTLQMSGSSRVRVALGLPDWLGEGAQAPHWQLGANTDFAALYQTPVVEARLNGLVGLDGQQFDGQIYEAYLMARPTDWLDISLGQKRLAFGGGSNFNPGDYLHPLEALGSQKTGFRGGTIRCSLGQELALALAVSADRVIGPGTGTFAKPSTTGGSQNLADLLYAATLDWQLEALTVGMAWFYAFDTLNAPLLWLSYDFDGIILSAEGSTSLTDLLPSGVLSLRWQGSVDESDLSAAVEYLYQSGGTAETSGTGVAGSGLAGSGLSGSATTLQTALPVPLRNQHYLWSTFSLGRQSQASLALSALLNLQDVSALVSLAATVQVVENLDCELVVRTCLAEQTTDEFYRSRTGVLNALFGLTLYW